MEQDGELVIDPHKYSPLIFYKVAKAVQWRKGSLLNKWCGTTEHPYTKRKNKWKKLKRKGGTEGRRNMSVYLIPYTKDNSKWTTDLNIKYKSIQLLKEYIGEHFCDLGLYKEITKITKEKKKISWTSLKLKALALQKTPLRKWKDKTQTERKYLQIM